MGKIATFCAGLLILAATSMAAAAQTSNPSRCAQPHGSGNNLSGQLGQSGGVICPPDMDPNINQPVPHQGTMPIVPAPGTPGGNPNVQPK
jgi:hypothetical protein